MNPSLTNLFASATSQALSKAPAPHSRARDTAGLASPGEDKHAQEFLLPPEPRDRSASTRNSDNRSNETRRSPENRGRENLREPAPRKEDLPRRTDPPRGTGRAHDGEPPRRSDPPRGSERAEDGAPPRRADPPGATKAEKASSGMAAGAGETDPETTVATESEADFCAAVQTSTSETALPGSVIGSTVETSPGASAASSPDAAPSGCEPTSSTAEISASPPSDADAHLTTLQEAGLQETGLQDAKLENIGGQKTEVAASETPSAEIAASLDGKTSDELQVHEEGLRHDQAQEAQAQPAVDPTLLEASEAIGAQEQATAAGAIVAAAGSLGDKATFGKAGEASNVIGQAGTAGAKGASAHHQNLLREGIGRPGQNSRADALPAGRGETSASEPGASGQPAVKPDILPATGEAHSSPFNSALSGAGPGGPPSGVQQAVNAPLRVVSEVPLGAVPVEIALKSLAGINHFEIRLDPGELGRIDVRLEIDKEGGVKAHLSVDRIETLALLQRDARTLERAFDQAGLKLSEGSVDLSLRDQQAQGQGRQEHGDQRRDGSRHPHSDMRRDDTNPALAELPRRSWRGAAGVDVRI